MWMLAGGRLAFLLFLLSGPLSPAVAMDNSPPKYAIAQQPLGDALRALAYASGYQLLFRARDVNGLKSNTLSGRRTVEDALEILLRGTGLTARRVAQRTFIIERERRPAAAAPKRSPSVRAPTASSQVKPDWTQAAALADIVVTARRYEESLQNTPVAVNAFSRLQLKQAGVMNLHDLDGLAPSINVIEGNGGVAGVFVRGIGQSDFLLSNDPGVGVYLDGVYLGRIFGSAIDTMDIERVEVIRGPQGTLYGRNAEAGAISIQSVKPHQEVEASAELWSGSRERLDFQGVYNQPLTDSSAMRIALGLRHQDGYIQNLTSGENAGDVNRQMLRIGYLNDLPSQVRLSLTGDFYRQRERGQHYNLIGLSAFSRPYLPTESRIEFWNRVVAPAMNVPPLDERYFSPRRTMTTTTGLQSDVDHAGINLTLEGTWSRAQWKSISAYRQLRSAWGADYDRSPVDMWLASVPRAKQRQFSQEFQLTGLLQPDVRFTAGLFAFREIANDDHVAGMPIGAMAVLNKAAPHSIAAPGFAGLACPNPDPAINLSSCIGGDPLIAPQAYARAVELQLAAPIFSSRRTSNLNLAIYGQISYTPSPPWEISAGFRLNYDRKNATYSDTIPSSSQSRSTRRKLDWVTPTWSLSLSHHPADALQLYVSWNKGYKAGGINMRPLQNVFFLESYDPEENSNIEIGVKSSWMEDRIRLNFATYVGKYSDFQLFSYTISGDHLVSTSANRANATIYGFETDFTIALTSNLLLEGMAAHQKWRYDGFTDKLPDVLELSQSRPTLLPSTTMRAVLRWEHSLSGGELTTQADVRWRGDMLLYYGFATRDGDPRSITTEREPPSTELGFHAAYALNKVPVEFFFHVDNVFDQAARTNFFNSGVVAELWNKPREWRVGLRYNF